MAVTCKTAVFFSHVGAQATNEKEVLVWASVNMVTWDEPGAIDNAAKANPVKSFPKSMLIDF